MLADLESDGRVVGFTAQQGFRCWPVDEKFRESLRVVHKE